MADVTTTGIGPLAYATPAREPKRTMGRRLLVWSVGIIVIAGMLISILLPSLCRSRETANRVKCASNLRMIGQAILLYAQDNGGQYPPTLAELPAHEEITAEVMTCPSSNDEKSPATDTAGVVADLRAAETNAPGHKLCLSYVYVGSGLNSKTVSDTAIVAYEPLNNHDGDGTNVLFGDGHVEFVGKQSWPAVAAAAGVSAVSSRPTRP